MRLHTTAFILLTPLLAQTIACGGDDGESQPAGSSAGGQGGSSGSSGQSGKGGSGGKATGGSAGQGGAGAGGAAGAAGLSGSSGQSGSAGSAAGSAGGGGEAGGSAGAASGSGGSGGSAGSGGSGGSSGNAGSAGSGGEATCAPGCQGFCLGGVCCDVDRACGGVCCGGGQVCSFQECVVPGASCQVSDDCGESEYCALPVRPGSGECGPVAQALGQCLPKPAVCPPGAPPSDSPDCVVSCQGAPFAGAFEPELKYTWGGDLVAPYATDSWTTPIVVHLDDDNCDGVISAQDTPEIAVVTFANRDQTTGEVHVLSVQDGKLVEKWSLPGVHPLAAPAGGNINGQPGNELVVCGAQGDDTIMALDGSTGALLWKSEKTLCGFPALADLDQDGTVEVITEGGIFEGATGKLKHAYKSPMVGTFAVSDIDGDGFLDIVTSSQAYDRKGTMFIDTGEKGYTPSDAIGEPFSTWWRDTFLQGPAVADLDNDGKPEVIGTLYTKRALVIWQYDATSPQGFKTVRAGVDVNGAYGVSKCPEGLGKNRGGGPVTVGDFDGDGTADVGLAAAVTYSVFSGKKLMDAAVPDLETFMWQKETQDCTSAATGSSLFDFEGDGKVEVVYSDEVALRVYDGPTGAFKWETCNTSATASENPIIVDVDNDGQADIVAVSNAGFREVISSITCAPGSPAVATAGLRVWSSKTGGWARTRAVWNQHSYHITNVTETGEIPPQEPANWLTKNLNNFRQNRQPSSALGLPDAVVALVAPSCEAGQFAGLIARVRNVGEALLPAGVEVGFYAGDQKLGSKATSQALLPLQSEDVLLPLASPPPELTSGQLKARAVVDDGGAPHPAWVECDTSNNSSTAVYTICGKL